VHISEALSQIYKHPIKQDGSLHGLIFGCMFLCILSFALTATLLLLYPYGVNYGEAPLISQAQQLISHYNIYKPSLQTPPYVIANYTPIYPLLVGMIHFITHLPLFQSGRALSIFAGLASSVLIGSMTHRLLKSTTAGYISAALFLGHPFVGLWSGLARVDMLALAFSLAGLWIICIHGRSTPWNAAAIVCLLASVYTRQTYLLAAPIASAVWLIHNDRKRGAAFMAMFILIGLAIFLGMNTITHGGFYTHIVTANVNYYSIQRIASMGVLFIFSALILMILSASAIRNSTRTAPDSFVVWGLLPYTVGALLTAITVGKIGSDINYFLELIGVLAIWTAFAWSLKPSKLTTLVLVAHCIWVLGFSLILFQLPIFKAWHRLPEVDSLALKVKAAARLGPVLADDRLDLVVLTGLDIYYQPFEYTQLYNAGIWDIQPFEKAIASHQFPLILIHSSHWQERWPDPIYEAIQRNYSCNQQTETMVCQPKR
jgi:hypothetical protein